LSLRLSVIIRSLFFRRVFEIPHEAGCFILFVMRLQKSLRDSI
jgi:hypothetical protein